MIEYTPMHQTESANRIEYRLVHLSSAFYASLRTWFSTALAALAIACLFLCGGQSTAFAANKTEEKQVEPQFRHLYRTIGEKNPTEIVLVSGSEAIKMRNGRVPGKRWLATCGTYKFKLTIQDGVDLTIEQLVARLEKLPLPYARAFEVVSDEAEDGIAVYKNLGGAAAHGGKQYINIIPSAGPMIIAHEVGHTLEQKARESDPKILDKWEAAIEADKASISNYGDKVRHEDLGEFSKVYAACLSAGEEQLSKLRKLSPARTQLWESILNDSASSHTACAQEQTLADIFEPIAADLGQLNLQRATITDGPQAVKMKRGGTPGKQWSVSLGISTFLVTIEDGARTTITDAIALAEKMPVRYRRALIIASGNEVDDDALKDRRRTKDEDIRKADAAKADREGLAFYASVKSPQCTGNSMAMLADTTPEVRARASGLLLANRLREAEADLFERWAEAAKADGIRVSRFFFANCMSKLSVVGSDRE
jgi:hypothetical protein